MVIVGSKGFAKELLEILNQQNSINNIVFFDDINLEKSKLFNRFSIIHEETDIVNYFENYTNEFTLGLGKPNLRYKMYQKFIGLGGKFCSVISSKAEIGSFGSVLGEGCNVMPGAIISNDVILGKGNLVYYNAIITHDCQLGDFVEVAPGVTILGRAKVNSFTQLGSNSTILPDVEIGANVIVGAGAVVTKNVPSNSIVVGVPARIVGIHPSD